MKRLALPLAASLCLAFAACSDNPSKSTGDEQVPQPVQNSGTETEAARATKAVSDSAAKGQPADTTPAKKDDHNH